MFFYAMADTDRKGINDASGALSAPSVLLPERGRAIFVGCALRTIRWLGVHP